MIITNEAGMLFDIRYFHFWNSAKAGMSMKISGLSNQSRNVYESKSLIILFGRARGKVHAMSTATVLVSKPLGSSYGEIGDTRPRHYSLPRENFYKL